ncbi:MAG: ATP-binding protein [candidate division Zixibacteria bacterium]|nr:ATP-binding protein [candidate division Zixibacteria bacterium]
MIPRPALIESIRTALSRSKVVILAGPRQCGKTTLARQFVSPDTPNYFDLEDPLSLARLDEPVTALGHLQGLVVIDEVQRRPDLFSVLRVLADRNPVSARFLLLGSASPALLRQSSESLAGRVERIVMSGLNLSEIGFEKQNDHWRRGGFPLSFLATTETDSFVWRRNFILTLLERDIPQLGFNLPPAMLYRFWVMLAHYHGKMWKAAEAARSLGVSENTTRRYLDLLERLYMIRQLQPWHVNLKKRQIKSPKIYFRDTGLLHGLLGIRSENDLLSHPKCGASWEGYVVEETIRAVEPDEAYFWGTHNGAELDLLLIKNGRKWGVECKRQDAPRITPSMRTALGDLQLDRLVVVYPGDKSYSLSEQVTVVPLNTIAQGTC